VPRTSTRRKSLEGTRLEETNAAERRAPSPIVHQREVLQGCRRIELLVDQPTGVERTHLRAEDETLAGQFRDVERLDPVPVAGDRQLTLPLVPDRAGEHAVQPAEQPVLPLLPAMHQNLGVRVVRRKDMAGGLELLSELAVIVDLAVEDDPYGAVLVAHRLVARDKIDDRKSAEAQCYVGRGIVAVVIRTAVLDAGRHAADALVRVRTRAKMQNA
jgi:hypothetical protein